MSKTTHIIELRPPKSAGSKEHLAVGPFICHYCGGRGYFEESWCNRDAPHKPCPNCQGTGKVIADIHIEWKPYKQDQ